jgi:hypothetical protein
MVTKQRYKQQLGRAMQDINVARQQEHSGAQDRLQREQRELQQVSFNTTQYETQFSDTLTYSYPILKVHSVFKCVSNP